jgi:hypothetical protein
MTVDEVCVHSPPSPKFDNNSPLQMRELGFDGYAIDFVDCPHAMRGFLMRECQLHRTVRPLPSLCEIYYNFAQAIALPTSRLDPARAMEVVSRTGGGNYIVGKTMNMVTRSQYGRRLPQNLTRDVRPARVLVGPTGLSTCFPPAICPRIKLLDQSTPLRGAISSSG